MVILQEATNEEWWDYVVNLPDFGEPEYDDEPNVEDFDPPTP